MSIVLLVALMTIPPITAPPDDVRTRLDLGSFYTQYVDVHGFSVVASERVAPAALGEAAWILIRMLEHRPEIFRALNDAGVRLVVMSEDEWTTDIPEHADLAPSDYWDRRARGLGATGERPAVSCGEENLLGFPGDPYPTENILIHEFSHAIHEMALSTLDDSFDPRLIEAYTGALADGRWTGTYAASNVSEYWAEGTQSWFDTNRTNDEQHNEIGTREALKRYDPPLAALLADVYGVGEWRYTPASTRRELPHLRGWSFEDAPTFAWPLDIQLRAAAFAEAAAGEPLPRDSPWRDAPPLDTDEVWGLRSAKSDVAASLLIVNQSAEPVFVEWIDFDGLKHAYGRVRAMSHLSYSTYREHVWVIRDTADVPLVRVRVEGDRERVVITGRR